MPANKESVKRLRSDLTVLNRVVIEGYATLAQEFGLPEESIRQEARKLGLRVDPKLARLRRATTRAIRNPSVNVDFFKEWNRNTSYVAGYVWADGSVQKRNYLKFHSSVLDEDLVDGCRTLLGSSHKMSRTLGFFDKEGRYNSPAVGLQVCSRVLLDDLMRLSGVEDNKSGKDLEFPKVPGELLPAFTRGVFDGDGCAFINRGQVGLHLLGSAKFIITLQELLVKELGIARNKPSGTIGTISVRWEAKTDIQKLMNWMYADGGLYSKRKKRILEKGLGLEPSEESVLRRLKGQMDIRFLLGAIPVLVRDCIVFWKTADRVILSKTVQREELSLVRNTPQRKAEALGMLA
jgi:hypothetical protein